MTDNELLLALSNMLDEKLNNELQPIKNDITEMKNDINDMKNVISDMKNDINELKTRISNVEIAVTDIKLILENEIRVNIQRVAEGHLDLSRNMHDAMKPNNEIEMLAIKVSMLETDMRYLKQKIS